MRIERTAKFLRDGRGASAGEFALILPGFAVLAIGSFHLMFLMFATASLHSAVEDAARCASIKPTACPNIDTYGDSRYGGPRIATNFSLAPQACGSQVTGTANYAFETGLTRFNVPITAVSCFP